MTTACVDAGHGERVVTAVRESEGVTVEGVLDRTFEMHKGGKIQINASVPVKTRDDLSMAYTPGIARVCTTIHASPERVWSLSAKGNLVAVVPDGTAVSASGTSAPRRRCRSWRGRRCCSGNSPASTPFRLPRRH